MRLVLLHALPFDGRMWHAERDAVTVPPGPMLAPTLYGLGTTLEERAQSVLDLAGGDDPLVVVGCSVGGSCALEIAHAAPHRVAGIVLIGAKAGVRPEPALRDDAVRVLTEEGLAAAWDRYWRPLFGPSTPAALLDRARHLALDQDVDDIVRGVRAFHDRRDRSEFARDWPGPLVVVSGAHDRSPSPATTAPLGAGPNRAFHLVERSGHYVNLERPAELRTILQGHCERIASAASASASRCSSPSTSITTRSTRPVKRNGPR